MPKCLQCANWESVRESHCSRCGSLMPPPDEAARAAYRERRRKAREERDRPPTPQEAREATRRLLMEAIGPLLPIPAVPVVAGIAVVIAGEALPIAIVAAVAGTITGWLVALVIYRAQLEFRLPWERPSWVYEWVAAYLPYAAAAGVTLLVSRIL